MRETRQAILANIKRRGSTTVNDLADEMEISPVTVRHHLYALMADNLIERVPIRHGVGRPQHGYSLTDTGRRQFPSRYHVLTTHLLSALKHLKSEEDVRGLLTTIVRQLIAVPPSVDGLSPEARLEQLEHHFSKNDIPISIHYEAGEDARLELSCPYYYVSQHHPELCSVDEQLIGEMLQMPMVRTGCLLEGDRNCTFSIKLVKEQQEHNKVLESGSK